jgi:hypothetical protein
MPDNAEPAMKNNSARAMPGRRGFAKSRGGLRRASIAEGRQQLRIVDAPKLKQRLRDENDVPVSHIEWLRWFSPQNGRQVQHLTLLHAANGAN